MFGWALRSCSDRHVIENFVKCVTSRAGPERWHRTEHGRAARWRVHTLAGIACRSSVAGPWSPSRSTGLTGPDGRSSGRSSRVVSFQTSAMLPGSWKVTWRIQLPPVYDVIAPLTCDWGFPCVVSCLINNKITNWMMSRNGIAVVLLSSWLVCDLRVLRGLTAKQSYHRSRPSFLASSLSILFFIFVYVVVFLINAIIACT